MGKFLSDGVPFVDGIEEEPHDHTMQARIIEVTGNMYILIYTSISRE